MGGAAYGGGTYVAVGQSYGDGNPNICSSPDGKNWTSRNSSPSIITDVAYGNGRFVAVGDQEFYLSLNGTRWVAKSFPGAGQISFGNGIFIVPFASGTNLISSSGAIWTAAATGLTNSINKPIYVNGLFIAMMSAATNVHLVTSSDGTNWIEYPQNLPVDGRLLASNGTNLVGSGRGSDHGDNQVYVSGPLVSVSSSNMPPGSVAVSGLVGWNYQIQSTDTLGSGSNSWQTNAAFALTNTPCIWADPASNGSQRFYRGVLLP